MDVLKTVLLFFIVMLSACERSDDRSFVAVSVKPTEEKPWWDRKSKPLEPTEEELQLAQLWFAEIDKLPTNCRWTKSRMVKLEPEWGDPPATMTPCNFLWWKHVESVKSIVSEDVRGRVWELVLGIVESRLNHTKTHTLSRMEAVTDFVACHPDWRPSSFDELAIRTFAEDRIRPRTSHVALAFVGRTRYQKMFRKLVPPVAPGVEDRFLKYRSPNCSFEVWRDFEPTEPYRIVPSVVNGERNGEVLITPEHPWWDLE